MADSITVTFGGREWVLKRDENYIEAYQGECLRVATCHRINPQSDTMFDEGWLAEAFNHDSGFCRSRESAVCTLETKLRAIHAELGRVLGVSQEESEHGR